MNSGSLGMGLSFALGCALAARLGRKDYMVYALLGDGECDEGEIWEAAMSAAHHKAANLIAFVDRNRIQNDRFTDQVMTLEPLARKWRDLLGGLWKRTATTSMICWELCIEPINGAPGPL